MFCEKTQRLVRGLFCKLARCRRMRRRPGRGGCAQHATRREFSACGLKPHFLLQHRTQTFAIRRPSFLDLLLIPSVKSVHSPRHGQLEMMNRRPWSKVCPFVPTVQSGGSLAQDFQVYMNLSAIRSPAPAHRPTPPF